MMYEPLGNDFVIPEIREVGTEPFEVNNGFTEPPNPFEIRFTATATASNPFADNSLTKALDPFANSGITTDALNSEIDIVRTPTPQYYCPECRDYSPEAELVFAFSMGAFLGGLGVYVWRDR